MEEQDFVGMLEGEFDRFIKVWASGLLCISYSYFVGKLLHKGLPRLAAIIPAIALFFFLPLQLNTLHFGGITSFFLSWLANFKLILFAFDQGPLASAGISLQRFIAVACLPIKVLDENPSKEVKTETWTWRLNYGIKVILLGLIVKIYDYQTYFNPIMMNVLYTLHMYVALDLITAITAVVARGSLGVELEPQFDEPYLSNSLQDFWGRRWNIMASRILRPTVYLPVRNWFKGVLGHEAAAFPAIIATFVVSGVMHELIFYYLGRLRPTWEVTWFFVLHGACLVVEIILRRALKGRLRIPTVFSVVFTIAFLMLTAFWLFFPPFLRLRPVERTLTEMASAGVFVKDVLEKVRM